MKKIDREYSTQEIHEVTDLDTQEVKTETTLVGTGEYEVIPFSV